MVYVDPNKPEKTIHYVARIVVERVDQKPCEVMQHGSKVWVMNRTATEVTSLTVKSDDLADLITKTGKHLDLVEDIDALDPVKPRGTRSSES